MAGYDHSNGDRRMTSMRRRGASIGDDFAPARRRPVEEVTYLDTWGKPIA
jgi:hypothetical protein